MVLIIGSVVVIVSVVAGLAIGGGSIMVLAHASEFVTILGISLGVMIIASPISTLVGICKKTVVALKGGPFKKTAYIEGLEMLYRYFMLARKEGLLALEGHLTDIQQSSIAKEYPSFLNNPQAVSFFVDSLRPLVDGRVKPMSCKVWSIMRSRVCIKSRMHQLIFCTWWGILFQELEFVPRFWGLF